MSQIARTNDFFTGICSCHKSPIGTTGIIISGESNITSSGKPIAHVGSVGIAFCGHGCIVVSGSSVSTVNGKQIARVGDVVTGCVNGTIISGDPISDTI